MAFPTIPTVAAGRVLSTNQADTSGTRTFPSLSSLTKSAGDLLIAIVVCHGSSTTSDIFSSWGGGFTEFHDSGGSSEMCVGMAYKWSTGSETGTFSVTQAGTVSGHASLILLAIPGAHASTPPEAGSRAVGTSSAADPASFDPSGWAAEDTLWISVVGSGMTSGTGSWTATGTTAPTNYTDRVDSNTTDNSTTGQTEIAVAFRQVNASSENVGTAGVDTSNARNVAVVVAIRPEPEDARARVSWAELELPEAPAVIGEAGAVSGGGAVAGSGQKGGSGLAAASSGGAVAASVQKGGQGSASASGGGSVAASGGVSATGSASVSGGGAVASSTQKGGQDSASVSSGGAVAGAGQKGGQASGAVSSGGAVSSTGQKGGQSTASVSGGGDVVAAGGETPAQARVSWAELEIPEGAPAAASGSASVSGGGAVSVEGARVIGGSASASGGGAVSSSGQKGALSSKRDRTAAGGLVYLFGDASYVPIGASTDGSVTAVGSAGEAPSASGSASVSGGGAVVAAGQKGGQSLAAVSTGGQVSTAYTAQRSSVVSVSGGGSVTETHTTQRTGITSVSGGGSVAAIGVSSEDEGGTGSRRTLLGIGV